MDPAAQFGRRGVQMQDEIQRARNRLEPLTEMAQRRSVARGELTECLSCCNEDLEMLPHRPFQYATVQCAQARMGSGCFDHEPRFGRDRVPLWVALRCLEERVVEPPLWFNG